MAGEVPDIISLQAECGGAMTLLFRFAPATFGSLSAVELNLY